MLPLKTIIWHNLIRQSRYNLIRHLTKDPGIGFRKKMLSRVDEKDLEMPDFDDLESDFMDVHKSHKEHVRQVEAVKEREKYLIVRQKYFKEKFPNFLTWHDKEQIRYLYRTDPEEWTIDKLSEGFPALPETIKKIVRSNWTQTAQDKITKHDKSVQKNWELFKKGQMRDLPNYLKEHLNKFTNRALNFNNFIAPDFKKSTIIVKTNSVGSEFSEIITSYEKMKNNTPQIEDHTINLKNHTKPLKETYVASKPFSRKSIMTLDHLQEKLKNKIESGTSIDEEEKIIVMNLKQEKKLEKIDAKLETKVQKSYPTSTEIQMYEKSEKDLSLLKYPEKISIPKDIFKKGFIYKLNDCYYDDDGEFLYRVPGMD